MSLLLRRVRRTVVPRVRRWRSAASTLAALSAVSTLSTLSALLTTAPSAWAASCEMEPMTLPVRLVQHRPVATVTVNGQPMDMLVDSGAAISLMPESTAEQLKLTLHMLPFRTSMYGHAGSLEASRTWVKTLGFGSAELKNVLFVVGGNEHSNGIKGILGRNILALGDTEYDLAHGIVRLVFPKGDCEAVSMAYWAKDAPVIVARFAPPPSGGSDAARVQVKVNGVPMTALMDTGARATNVTLPSARRAGVQESAMTPFGHAAGLGEDKVRRWLADFDTFQIGGETLTHQRLVVDEVESGEYDLLLGLDYFLAHRVYVSRLQGKVYATWNGTEVFARHPGAARNELDTQFARAPDAIAPTDAEGLARRGMALQSQGKLQEALDHLNRAIALKPEEAQYRLARARVHRALRHNTEALADLGEALRLDPSLHTARLLRAELAATKPDRAAALADLRELDAQLPPSAGERATMGDLYAHLDQKDDALRQYQLWLGTHANDIRQAQVLNQRCWLRARTGTELAEALQDCQRALKKDGDMATYHSTLGWVYLRQGDTRKAISAFDAAIEKDARLSWAYFGRALSEWRQQDSVSADRDLAKARQLRPGIDEAVQRAGFELPQAWKRPAG